MDNLTNTQLAIVWRIVLAYAGCDLIAAEFANDLADLGWLATLEQHAKYEADGLYQSGFVARLYRLSQDLLLAD